MKTKKKSWGKELWIVNTKKYGGKLLKVERGKWSSNGKFHYHKEKDETFFVIKGDLLLDIKDRRDSFERMILKKGDSIRIKPYTLHRFTTLCIFGAEFVEFSTPYKLKDSYYDIQ